MKWNTVQRHIPHADLVWLRVLRSAICVSHSGVCSALCSFFVCFILVCFCIQSESRKKLLRHFHFVRACFQFCFFAPDPAIDIQSVFRRPSSDLHECFCPCLYNMIAFDKSSISLLYERNSDTAPHCEPNEDGYREPTACTLRSQTGFGRVCVFLCRAIWAHVCMCRVFVENCSCVDRSIESEARFRVFMCVRRARALTHILRCPLFCSGRCVFVSLHLSVAWVVLIHADVHCVCYPSVCALCLRRQFCWNAIASTIQRFERFKRSVVLLSAWAAHWIAMMWLHCSCHSVYSKMVIP